MKNDAPPIPAKNIVAPEFPSFQMQHVPAEFLRLWNITDESAFQTYDYTEDPPKWIPAFPYSQRKGKLGERLLYRGWDVESDKMPELEDELQDVESVDMGRHYRAVQGSSNANHPKDPPSSLPVRPHRESPLLSINLPQTRELESSKISASTGARRERTRALQRCSFLPLEGVESLCRQHSQHPANFERYQEESVEYARQTKTNSSTPPRDKWLD